jgi:hypothetical protein
MNSLIRKNTMPSFADVPHPFSTVLWPIREHPEKPETKRVDAILELLSDLRDELKPMEKAQIQEQLRKALRRYKWVSRVVYTKQGLRVIHGIADRDALTPDEIWEQESVCSLLDVVPVLGARPRIRRCAECKNWFFAAKRDDQEYCSGVCRQHHYDNDPERRKKKAADMRNSRADEKKRARNPKSGVGLRARRSGRC